MKTQALVLVVSALAACGSDPGAPAPGAVGGGGQGGTNSGVSGSGGGSAGTPAAAGSAPIGTAGSASGGNGGAGGGSGGASDSGGGGAGAGASGSAGAGGTGGSGGTPDPGNLPNMVPAGYTGTPFGGTPQTIPGKIEIEKYDVGGAGVAFQADPMGGAFDKCGFMRTDALKLQCTQQAGSPPDKALPGCGDEPAGQIYLGYIGAGNWYKYTVHVLEAGTYVISGHSGVAGNTQMKFAFTDAVATGNLTLPSTDKCSHEAYHVWEEQQNLGEIALQPGKYVLTITSVAAAMNLDWFAFTKK